MHDVLFARAQMGMSLGFHIVFACVGIAMPALMVMAEVSWLRTGDREYLTLAKKWAKGTAVLFAVGAVSGTVLSFELGLLFPGFMRHAGALIGMPFSLEGFAFFLEAIFLGIYLYGWDRVRPRFHVGAGILVALSGLASAVFVTFVNAWMNAPRGFRLVNDTIVAVDPWAAMTSPFALHQTVHMALAAYISTGFAVAGIHALALLRRLNNGLHSKALWLALVVAVPCALAQPFVGHLAGQRVAEHQPLKLAAIEQLQQTQARAPLTVGPLQIPGALSLFAKNDTEAVVQGLSDFPKRDWPHPLVRWSFLLMVGIGTAQVALSVWLLAEWLRRRKRGGHFETLFHKGTLLKAIVIAGPSGFIATEAGWMVTEVGRQPWVVYGVLRTAETVTPMPGLLVPFVLFTAVYLGLSAAVIAVLRQQIQPTMETSRV